MLGLDGMASCCRFSGAPCSSGRAVLPCRANGSIRRSSGAMQACARDIREFSATGFSIGHRGAPLQFPEHTRESYEAAARMCRCPGMRCDLYRGQGPRVPPFPVRSAHHHRYPRHTAGTEVFGTLCARRVSPGKRREAQARNGAVLHERHHPGGVQDPGRQDGLGRCERDDRSRIPGWRPRAFATELYATGATLIDACSRA